MNEHQRGTRLSHTDILVKKLAVLVLLVSGQCPFILAALKLSQMHVEKDIIKFDIQNSEVKQGRQGYQPPPVLLQGYQEEKFCVVTHLMVYVDRKSKG